MRYRFSKALSWRTVFLSHENPSTSAKNRPPISFQSKSYNLTLYPVRDRRSETDNRSINRLTDDKLVSSILVTYRAFQKAYYNIVKPLFKPSEAEIN